MTIYYNAQDRKPLVKAISEFTGADAVYMRTPTYAYQIDYFTVTREGNLEFDDRADSEEIEGLIEFLAERGFIAEVAATSATEQPETASEEVSADTDSAEHGESVGLTVEVPLEGKFFANGAAPSGVLEHPGTIKDPTKVREAWQSQFGGSSNSGKVAVLEEGMKYTPISISPEQAQFLETRKFQINEIARIFECRRTWLATLKNRAFPILSSSHLNS